MRRVFARVVTVPAVAAAFAWTGGSLAAQEPDLPLPPVDRPALVLPAPLTQPEAGPDAGPDAVAQVEDDDLPTLPPVVVQGRRNPQGDASGAATAPSATPTFDPAPGVLPTPLPSAPQLAPPSSVSAPPSQIGDFPASPLPPDVVVSANARPIARNRLGSSVTVLTRPDIERYQQRTVLELLRQSTTPGLAVNQSGGPGRQTSVFIRGAESDHTKVLLDGIPLNDPSGNRAFDFSSLTIDNLDRVEVLRGPQSVLYGTDALGGVINLTTRRPDGPPEFRLSAEGGSRGFHREIASFSAGDEFGYASGSVSNLDTQGISAANSRLGFAERDEATIQTASGRLGFTLADGLTLDTVFRHSDAEAEFDGFGLRPDGIFGPVDDPNLVAVTESTFVRTQARIESFDGNVEQFVGFSNSNYNRASRGQNTYFYGDLRQVDYRTNVYLFETEPLTLVASGGLNYFEEDSRSTAIPRQRAQFARSIFGEVTGTVYERLTLSAGGRHDDYSLAGVADTWRTTGRYEFVETGTAVRGSLGTSFRAPSLSEYFGISGNPLLRPEESLGWDIGLEQWLWDDRLQLAATYFRNDFENLVQFVFDPAVPPPAFGRLENVQTALATGVELSAAFEPIRGTFLSASYTRTDTRDNATGLPLLRRPRDRFGFAINQQFADGRGNINLSVLAVANRTDFVGFAPGEIEDYTVTNLTGSYQLTDDVRLFGRVENLFDEDYEEVFGYGTIPASVFAGVEIRLR